ncbi:MAG: hypothetical protein M3P08_20165 [Thermoproteota archaeon]|jgi:hypothetical protein|nr:hypothetical protein [Thermoproteota archaeon]
MKFYWNKKVGWLSAAAYRMSVVNSAAAIWGRVGCVFTIRPSLSNVSKSAFKFGRTIHDNAVTKHSTFSENGR